MLKEDNYMDKQDKQFYAKLTEEFMKYHGQDKVNDRFNVVQTLDGRYVTSLTTLTVFKYIFIKENYIPELVLLGITDFLSEEKLRRFTPVPTEKVSAPENPVEVPIGPPPFNVEK